MSAAEAELVLAVVSQLLSPRCSVSRSGEAKTVGKVFANKMGALLAKTKGDAGDVPPGLDAAPVMLVYILHFLSTMFEVCLL